MVNNTTKQNNHEKDITAFKFLKLVEEGIKDLKTKNDFQEFLSLDLNIKDDQIGWTPTMKIILCNSDYDCYHLPSSKIVQICENSDINITNKSGWNYLQSILYLNNTEKLNLSNKQIIYLLNKNELNIYPHTFFKNYLNLILFYNKDQSLQFTNEQLFDLYDKTLQKFDKNQIIEEKINFIKYIKHTFPEFSVLYEKTKLLNNNIKTKHTTKLKL